MNLAGLRLYRYAGVLLAAVIPYEQKQLGEGIWRRKLTEARHDTVVD